MPWPPGADTIDEEWEVIGKLEESNPEVCGDGGDRKRNLSMGRFPEAWEVDTWIQREG